MPHTPAEIFPYVNRRIQPSFYMPNEVELFPEVSEMKKTYVCLLILFVAVFAFTGCNGAFSLNSGNAHYLATIDNWVSYKSFGVGDASIGSRAINPETGYELIGVREDGTIEALTYEDKTGKKVSKTLYVDVFLDYDRFAFVVLSLEPNSQTLTNDDLHYIVALGGEYFSGDDYLIDKQTGKLYLLGDNVGTFKVFDNSAGEVNGVFHAMDYTAYTGTSGFKVFSIDDNLQLVVETFPGENYNEVRIDRYLNIFYKSNGVTYVLSKENLLNVVPSESGKYLYQGFNGIVYYDNYLGMDNTHTTSRCYDESGNLVETSFVPQGLGISEYIQQASHLIHTDIDYIYWYSNNIYWVHFTDPEKIQYELKTFPSTTRENITICGSYLVWVNNAIIQTLDLVTSSTDTITLVNGSDSVFINKLAKGGDGRVYFSGVDQHRNTIDGVLNSDLTYSFETTPYSQNSSSIVYISPIN